MNPFFEEWTKGYLLAWCAGMQIVAGSYRIFLGASRAQKAIDHVVVGPFGGRVIYLKPRHAT